MALTPEQQKARFERIAKIGVILVVGYAASSFILAAIGGLIGLGIAAGIAVAGVNLAPVLAMKMANIRMKAIMDEARKHPIETMLTIYTDNMKTIKEADDKIRKLAARLLDFRDKAKEFSVRYPQRAAQYNQMITNMQAVLDRWVAKQRTAKSNAKLYADKIEEAKAVYEMGKEAAGLQELVGDAEKEVTQNILKQVSFDEVNHTFNMAVAELSLDVDTSPDFQLDKHKDELAFLSSSSPSTTLPARKETTEVKQ